MKRIPLFIVIALLAAGLTLVAQQGNRKGGRMNVDSDSARCRSN